MERTILVISLHIVPALEFVMPVASAGLRFRCLAASVVTKDSGGNILDLSKNQRVELWAANGLRIERDHSDGGVPGLLPGQASHQGRQLLEPFRGVADQAGKLLKAHPAMPFLRP